MKHKHQRLTVDQLNKIINPDVISIATAIDSEDKMILLFTYNRLLGKYIITNDQKLLHSTTDQNSALEVWNHILSRHDMLISEQ